MSSYRDQKAAQRASRCASQHLKTLIDSLHSLSSRRDLHRVWSDWLEMSAIAISNQFEHPCRATREARYLDIAKGYTREELTLFAKALATLCLEVQARGFDDVLGGLFMQLGLADRWKGQFFTPYTVSRVMAGITCGTWREAVSAHGFVTVSDPAVGGGAMLVALADVFQEQGGDVQNEMHVTGQDLDLRAVHMTYLQLSLYGIPGTVIHGNSLGPLPQDPQAYWFTPTHVAGGWGRRLADRLSRLESAITSDVSRIDHAPKPVVKHLDAKRQQQPLF